MKQLIECIPNFSEGRNEQIIHEIVKTIKEVSGIRLLHTDVGKAANRTVVTFVGTPEEIIQAAFLGAQKAKEKIDMSKHTGEHPRIGATDVCPLVPLQHISLEQTTVYTHRLAKKIADELAYPVYCYEAAALQPKRQNLAYIRAGEYEQLAKRLTNKDFLPDFGSPVFCPKTGATAVGARNFLIAYNVNLNTTSVQVAKEIAADIRETGRVKKDTTTGKILRNTRGEPLRIAGKCKNVKALGWYIEEYGCAQVSMNLTNIHITPVHKVFESCWESAAARGVEVTGSELIGLAPLEVFTDAGKYFCKQQRSESILTENYLVQQAIRHLGLDDLQHFKAQERVLEYLL